MRRHVFWNHVQTNPGPVSWTLYDGVVTVRTANGYKSTQLGHTPPETLAIIMAKELEAEREDSVA
jgi:hypothetical protein